MEALAASVAESVVGALVVALAVVAVVPRTETDCVRNPETEAWPFLWKVGHSMANQRVEST